MIYYKIALQEILLDNKSKFLEQHLENCWLIKCGLLIGLQFWFDIDLSGVFHNILTDHQTNLNIDLEHFID